VNEETTVVMAFFTLRRILLGALPFALPRITRKGLVFGTYLGEDVARGDAARQIPRGWDLGCVALLALAFGICFAGRPVAGNLTGTGSCCSPLPSCTSGSIAGRGSLHRLLPRDRRSWPPLPSPVRRR